jgi:hypothetical protein
MKNYEFLAAVDETPTAVYLRRVIGNHKSDNVKKRKSKFVLKGASILMFVVTNPIRHQSFTSSYFQ